MHLLILKRSMEISKNARGRPNDSVDVRISKTLSYILRHGAQKEGLEMRSDGFIKLDDLVCSST